MRNLVLAGALLSLCGGNLWAGQNDASGAPQTARQALIEMFFSKTPGTLVKHLPLVTRQALEKSGGLATMEQYSAMATQLQTKGKNIQTFETGSVLLSAEDPENGQKFEIAVENDALQGDQDDIELSFHTTKDGQSTHTVFMPKVTFSMKSEAGVWKLNEISVTIRLPLADPEFLKGITEGIKARATAANSQPHIQISGQPSSEQRSGQPGSGQMLGSDASVLAAVKMILAAEGTYASRYPTVGYTCTLSDLDGFGGGEPNEHQAMLINSGLASGKKFGYVFTLSGCIGAPAGSFHLTAAPNGTSYGRRAFCADRAGVIRSSADGNAASCLSSGTPVQ